MLLGPVDSSGLAEWICSIPFSEWPQQHPVDDQLRPSMVTDKDWNGFYDRTDSVLRGICDRFFPDRITYQRMLSVVMPGHSIPTHTDGQADYFICRVHVPLTSNAQSHFIVNGEPRAMVPGFAYRVDTRQPHAVTNNGETPRIHFMFDVRK